MTPTDNNLGHAPGGDDDAHPIFANAPNNPSLWGRDPRGRRRRRSLNALSVFSW